jgi:hypothetical protein
MIITRRALLAVLALQALLALLVLIDDPESPSDDPDTHLVPKCVVLKYPPL